MPGNPRIQHSLDTILRALWWPYPAPFLTTAGVFRKAGKSGQWVGQSSDTDMVSSVKSTLRLTYCRVLKRKGYSYGNDTEL